MPNHILIVLPALWTCANMEQQAGLMNVLLAPAYRITFSINTIDWLFTLRTSNHCASRWAHAEAALTAPNGFLNRNC